jgi:uncharacterized membrane protein YdjX (TVP38/TMEM64 family)
LSIRQPQTHNDEEKSTHNLHAHIEDEAQEEVTVHGRAMTRGTIFKLLGLAAFFVLCIIIVVAIWPYIQDVMSEGGLDRVLEYVRNAGPWGVLILIGLEFLQVVVAFIPGEVVQMAAGILYGPILGTIIIIIGCIISSGAIYAIVHKLGAPFVSAMVPTKYLDKFKAFEKSGKLNTVIFVLFLIPGLSKDTFTYLVPLTDMPLKTYLTITTVARIPGVLLSTYAASGLLNGDIKTSIAIFVIVAIIAGIAALFKDRLLKFAERFHH